EVRAALIEAAAELLAERGPRAVSAREIARRARVNHGLVHRHFGSKETLIRAVLDELVSDARARFAPGAALGTSVRHALLSELAHGRRYFQVLARALLDGYVDWLQDAEFPVIRSALDALSDAQRRGALDASYDPRALTATWIALALGWLVFEPFALAASGLANEPAEEVRARVLRDWERLAVGALARHTAGAESLA